MPHEWRSPARSGVSPHACATESARPVAPAITGALADRAAIDWDALCDRAADSRERAALQTLRRLDERGGRRRGGAVPPPRTLATLALRLLVVLAASHVASGFATAAATLAAAGPLAPVATLLPIAAAFAAAALLLAPAAARDQRVLLLLAAFTFAAGAFARAVHIRLGGDASTALFRGVFPEAFAPAALAQFAVLFPLVHRFTRGDVWLRRFAAAAWVLASVLFAANLLIAYGLAGGAMAHLDRNRGTLFWYLCSVVTAAAVLWIFLRARRSPPPEQRRVARLGYALASGMAPFLLAAAARLIQPGAEGRLSMAPGGARLGLDVFVLGALAAMPIFATIAIVVDRPFDVPIVATPSVRRWWTRVRLRAADPAGMGSSRRRHARVEGALARLRQASGPKEAAAVLRRELRFGVAARSVTILEADEIQHGSALLAMLEASAAPIALSRESEPLTLLPAGEREWLQDADVRLAAAVRPRHRTAAAIVLLGPRRDGGRYDRIDEWFVSTLLDAAAAAWDAGRTADGDRDEAVECARCGAVGKARRLSCACEAAAVPARLPRLLAGKFEVTRRIGSGGMGVVYLARDAALGRDVALKTLPAHRGDAVARLRDEARAMAALDHPALATLYGLELWRGSPVLVVEYMAGGTLAARLTKGPMRLEEILSLGITVADALAYMHAHGVLHRDVKPGNIGMTADGAVKLFDFGLAWDEGTPAGTPAYLPREALTGSAPDEAVDLWALALVLRDAGGARHTALDAFFRRALAPARADRYESAAAMRDALLDVR